MDLQIILSNGMRALVSAEDYPVLSQFKWQASKSQQRWQKHPNWYACRFVTVSKGKREKRYMHREIAETPKGEVTDHINGNTLDNRRENLRNCTHKENFAYSCGEVDRSGEWA